VLNTCRRCLSLDSCELGIKFAGIIYLHEISQTRFVTTGGSLTTFDTLYRPDTAQNIILATTKWKHPEIDAERDREKRLSQYWTGPHVLRFVDTHESAWEIVNLILQNDPLDTPQFHEALVTLLERLPKTKASTWEILTSLFGKLFAVCFLRIPCAYLVYCGLSERPSSQMGLPFRYLGYSKTISRTVAHRLDRSIPCEHLCVSL
jgi:hypothetical protein